MIHSMTGFGKATCKSREGIITVEMKALNHKFFEVSAKIPNGLARFEDSIKAIINKSVKRGKVYINIELNGHKEPSQKVTVDIHTAKRYSRELLKLKKALRLKGDVKFDQIVALPGVVVPVNTKTDHKKVMPRVRKALSKALAELVRDRQKEGRALYRDLAKRAENIRYIVDHIDKRSDMSIVKYKNHLARMIKELTGARGVDKGRLEQEVALFAKNCDISEELTRIRSHLVTFRETLHSAAEVGKKLDFIAQELHREANTIASKGSDYKISRGVIQIKSDIEKIREQVKNVE